MDFIINSVSPILQLGLVPTLLLLFVKFFFDKDKSRETQLNDLQIQFEKREELMRVECNKREDQYKEREKILTAESARREEILKRESDKREKIIRDESIKRETALLETIDSFSKTMKEISGAMSEIKKLTYQVQYKVDNIESALQLSKGGA